MNVVRIDLQAVTSITELGKNWVYENIRLLSCIGACALVALAKLYNCLTHAERLPFDNWKISLGISRRHPFTLEELRQFNLAELAKKYSPIDLTQKLYVYIESHTCSSSIPNPQSPNEWLNWMTTHARNCAKIQSFARNILWGYEESPSRPEEEEKAIFVQNWITTLQSWALILGIESSSFSKSIFQTIQSSPRLAGSILFNFVAPLTAPVVWETIKESMPEYVKAVGDFYIEHSGKIALLILGCVALLYYKMRQEKGVLTNLTQQWQDLRGSHRGFDLVPTFQKCVDEMLYRIGTTKPGQPGSNIVWYYHQDTHSTFGDMIGEILAEMSATGRLYSNQRDIISCPYLNNLQIWELNLGDFLAEYRDPDEVYRGWRKIMGHIAKEKNVLVVIRNFREIKEYMLPDTRVGMSDNQGQGNGGRMPPRFAGEKDQKECLLVRLISQSLRTGEFRCIIEMDEEVKKNFEKVTDLYHLFSPIRSLSIPANELPHLFLRLFCKADNLEKISPKEITEWLKRLSPSLDSSPQHPQDLIDTVHEVTRKVEGQIRRLPNEIEELENALKNSSLEPPPGLIQRIEAAKKNWLKKLQNVEQGEKNLKEARFIKAEIIQKLWKYRRENQKEPHPLNKALLLVEHVVLPLFNEQLLKAKQDLISDPLSYHDHLVDTVQKRFNRLFGPCTQVELRRLEALPHKLKKDIVGQDIAIDAICNAVTEWRQNPDLNGKPLVLFTAGPTGVGKSETATKLAFYLNDVFSVSEEHTKNDEHNVLRIQLGRKKHGGVFGWDEIRTDIAAQILANPISVIVLEEWDKMNNEEKGQLNEFLEETNLYLQNRYSPFSERMHVNRSGVIFIITSNVAIESLSKPKDLKKTNKEQLQEDIEHIEAGIRGFFEGQQNVSQPILSRIDAKIPFHGITREDVVEIIKRKLNAMEEKGFIQNELRQVVEGELIKKIRTLQTNAWDVREVNKLINFEISSFRKRKAPMVVELK